LRTKQREEDETEQEESARIAVQWIAVQPFQSPARINKRMRA
jgi:hypothetical protein